MEQAVQTGKFYMHALTDLYLDSQGERGTFTEHQCSYQIFINGLWYSHGKNSTNWQYAKRLPESGRAEIVWKHSFISNACPSPSPAYDRLYYSANGEGVVYCFAGAKGKLGQRGTDRVIHPVSPSPRLFVSLGHGVCNSSSHCIHTTARAGSARLSPLRGELTWRSYYLALLGRAAVTVAAVAVLSFAQPLWARVCANRCRSADSRADSRGVRRSDRHESVGRRRRGRAAPRADQRSAA